jgi:glycosyltransferase involved in cell wall biosynthesis
MRVLVQALVAAPGGSVTVLRDLVAAWPAEDDLLVVCWRPEAAALLHDTGHDVITVPARSTVGALARLQVARPAAVRRFDADVVWSQAILVAALGRPQAVHYRDIGSFLAIHPDTLRQRLKERRERHDLHRADLRLYNSASLRDAAHTRHPGIAALPHAVVANGLDLEPVLAAAEPARRHRTTDGGDGILRILLPQGDAPHKRNPVAAAVLAELLADRLDGMVDVRLTVAGAGDYADLRQALDTADLTDRVSFAGYVPRPAMGRLYATHDLVLLTGAAESFGNPIIEAHAAGRPVVMPPFAVARELAGPFSTIADDDGGAALARAVRAALAAPADAEMDARARTFAEGFSATVRARELRELLAELTLSRVGR